MNRKRPRRDILCVSKRHLRTLCKLKADFISNILNTTVNSNDDISTRCSENTSNESHIQINDNIVNNYSVYEVNACNTCIQSNDGKCRESNNSQSGSQSSIVISSEELIPHVVSENTNITDTNMKRDLARWAVQHQISHTALTSLLQILRQHSYFSTLSLHAKSFLKTPRKQDK